MLGITLTLILLLAVCTLQVIPVEDLHRKSILEIGKDPYVQIHSSSSDRIDLHQEYLVLRVIEKEKRAAYIALTQLEERVLRVLKKHRIIIDDDALVKASIKPEFISKKRKWSFSLVFVIEGGQEQIEGCFKELARLGVQRLSKHSTINFLNEKTKSMEAFSKAKWALIRELKRFPDFQIKDVESIEIKGLNIENTDVIQNQIEKEYSDSQDLINESEFASLSDIEDNLTQEGGVLLKVIFKVGRVEQPSEQQIGESDDEESLDSLDCEQADGNSE